MGASGHQPVVKLVALPGILAQLGVENVPPPLEKAIVCAAPLPNRLSRVPFVGSFFVLEQVVPNEKR